MNYEGHVLTGLISYPFFILISGLMKTYLHLPLEMSTPAMLLGYALYVFGSDLPDIDHPNALIHRGSKAVIAVLVGSAVYTQAVAQLSLGEQWKTLTVAWTIGAAGALAAWHLFTLFMPRHRGIVHSLTFAAIYGLLALLLAEYGLNMRSGEALFAGFAAFSGYALHLLTDGSLKPI